MLTSLRPLSWMRSLRVLPAFCLILALVPASPSAATTDFEDWPQYRGPDRDGTVGAAPLARSWPESGPVELWRRDLGSGFSSVAVVGDTAFTLEAAGSEEAVVALDAATGETRWRQVVGEPMESEFGRGPRSTPTVKDGKVYAVSSRSRLLCMDAKTGEIVWEKDLSVYDPVPRFGYAASPVVIDGLVIIDVGTRDMVDAARAKAMKEQGIEPPKEGEPPPEVEIEPQVGAVAAFDAATGELVWRGGFRGPANYGSPVVAELAGVRQLVYSRFNRVAGLSLKGEPLWSHETPGGGTIPMPVILPGDVVFVSASDDHFGGLAVKVSRNEDGTWQTEDVWAERLMRNHFNTSIAIGDTLYGFDNATFKALDAATGKRRWAYRGFGKGSLVAAGDLLYVLGDDGTLALVHASEAGYKEAGRVQAMEGKAWTSPSLAGGRLFLRDHDEIVAYDVRAAAIAQVAPETQVPQRAETVATEAERQAAREAAKLSAEELLARHVKARGGKKAWSRIKTLEMHGNYNAFSEDSDFDLYRTRAEPQDLFKLEYFVFGVPGIRAVGPGGPWLQHVFLTTEPTRLADEPGVAPYDQQMRREAHFGPLLLEAEELGLTIETAGTGEINGRPVVSLKVTFPPKPEADGESEAEEGSEEEQAPQGPPTSLPEPVTETWHLDPETFLEVAVDSTIFDYTQGPQTFQQRAYFFDFREAEGVMIPHQVDLEFNARFEQMKVETLKVNGEIAKEVYGAPAPPAPAEEESAAEEG